MQVQAAAEEAGVRALAVMPTSPEIACAVADELGLRLEILCDPSWETHRLFGLGRAPWRRLVGPRVVWRWLRLVLAGRRPRRPAQDPRMLGADVAVDAEGRIVLFRASSSPADYASPAELVASAGGST